MSFERGTYLKGPQRRRFLWAKFSDNFVKYGPTFEGRCQIFFLSLLSGKCLTKKAAEVEAS